MSAELVVIVVVGSVSAVAWLAEQVIRLKM